MTDSNVYNGGLYIYTNVNLTNCNFKNNEAKYVGSSSCMASGADLLLMNKNANVTVYGCTFEHSSVTSSVAGSGSIHVESKKGYNAVITIKNSNFTNILSPNYGAVYLLNSTGELNNVTFDNCSAKYGGAII